MYFAAGAPIFLLGGVGAGVAAVGWFAYHNSEHVARRIDGFLSPDVDPLTQIGYATNAIQEGGFFGVGVGNGRSNGRCPTPIPTSSSPSPPRNSASCSSRSSSRST